MWYALELLVIGPAAGGVDETTSDTRNEELVGNDEFDHRVEFLLAICQHGVELLRLRNGAGEAVENEAATANVNISSPMRGSDSPVKRPDGIFGHQLMVTLCEDMHSFGR